MKKQIMLLITLIVIIFPTNVNADITIRTCRESEEFRRWQALSPEEQQETLMPPYCDSILNRHSINLGNNQAHNQAAFRLPDNQVPPLRDQQETDSCWAFTTMDIIESNLRRRQNHTTHLSPAHLELATQNTLFTPGRRNFNRVFNMGGNYFIAAPYILNQWGPITETSNASARTLMDIIDGRNVPTRNAIENVRPSVSVSDIKYIMNSQGACTPSARSAIKEYITTHGAIGTSVFMGVPSSDASITDGVLVDRLNNGAYYFYDGTPFNAFGGGVVPANHLPDHTVTIIGWDDNIPASRFSRTPAGNGAWRVKNSWGEMAGDQGYHYISYHDINVCSTLAGFFNSSQEVPDNAYFHDDLGWSVEVHSPAPVIYKASVFENKSGGREQINRVTFGTSHIGLNYQIYLAPNGTITNFKDNLIGSGTVSHIGYTAVPINNQTITTDRFTIVVRLSGTGAFTFPMAHPIEGTFFSTVPVLPGRSFFGMGSGEWADTAEEGFMNSIRVYTTSTGGSLTSPGGDINDSGNIDVLPPVHPNRPEHGGEPNSNPPTGLNTYYLIGTGTVIITVTIYVALRKVKVFH